MGGYGDKHEIDMMDSDMEQSSGAAARLEIGNHLSTFHKKDAGGLNGNLAVSRLTTLENGKNVRQEQ